MFRNCCRFIKRDGKQDDSTFLRLWSACWFNEDGKNRTGVVDLGSGAGIDVFLAANKVSDSGKAIGIDMTDEMISKARENALKGDYSNVEFKKGDIEENIPLNDNSVDAVISNCVINLTTSKTSAFKEV